MINGKAVYDLAAAGAVNRKREIPAVIGARFAVFVLRKIQRDTRKAEPRERITEVCVPLNSGERKGVSEVVGQNRFEPFVLVAPELLFGIELYADFKKAVFIRIVDIGKLNGAVVIHEFLGVKAVDRFARGVEILNISAVIVPRDYPAVAARKYHEEYYGVNKERKPVHRPFEYSFYGAVGFRFAFVVFFGEIIALVIHMRVLSL